MNYKKIYDDLISSRKQLKRNEKGHEKHHIIPISLGGKNNKDNLIILTPREHFLAHWLLWRIYRNRSMAYAFVMMSNRGLGNSRSREEAIIAHRETGHSEETRKKISVSKKKYFETHECTWMKSEEHRQRMSLLGKNRPPEIEAKMTERKRGRKRDPEIFLKSGAKRCNIVFPLVQKNLNGEIVNIWESYKDFKLRGPKIKINNVMTFLKHPERKKCYGYKWEDSRSCD